MPGGAMGSALRDLRKLVRGGTLGGLADGQLLARFAASNDGEAFEGLVARHGPMVMATCKAVLRHDQDVEDAFQTTFLILARKARSVRAGETLAGWLHRVAHRVAVEASLQAKQRRLGEASMALALAASQASRNPAEYDIRAIVHEAIGRLPERERIPVLLCDLEGLSYEQAAGRLGWSLPTLRCRLAKARRRLRERLSTRGPASAASGIAAAAREASAIVPEAWIRASVLAATCGTTSASVAALGRIILGSMFMTRLFVVAAVGLMAVAIGTLSVVASGAGGLEEPGPTPVAPRQADAPKVADAASKSSQEGRVVYRGRVLDPDGKPVEGASLYVATSARFGRSPETPPIRRAVTGADGRYAFDIAMADFDSTFSDVSWRNAPILALADGFGPAYAVGPEERDLRLARDDVPIEGRVIDLNGKPVAGARIDVIAIDLPKGADLAEWSASLKASTSASEARRDWLVTWDDPSVAELFPAVETRADGRFTLRGIGREHVAELKISGPTIETTWVCAVTRPFDPIRKNEFPGNSSPSFIPYCGPRFDHVAGPTQVVVGLVSDRVTRKPLPGVRVQGVSRNRSSGRNISTTTGPDGRYRLVGLPAARDPAIRVNVLIAFPPEGETYLPDAVRLEESRDLETITRDIFLNPCVWATGRVTDLKTGESVRATVDYAASEDNPYLKAMPDFGIALGSERHHTDKDGRYRLKVLPGRGIVAARADIDSFRFGVNHIVGMKRLTGGLETFRTRPLLVPKNYHVLVHGDPTAGPGSVQCDLQVDRGRVVLGRVVDPDGKPLPGCRISGLPDFYTRLDPHASADFRVLALGRDDTRVLLAVHKGKRLAGIAVIHPGDAGPISLRLAPWGTISGRLVDAGGQPRPDILMTSRGLYGKEVDPAAGFVPNDFIKVADDGRFKVDGLIPGLKYTFETRKGRKFDGYVLQDVSVKDSGTTELGDVKPGKD